MSICDFVTFSCGILGQVWYLVVSIPDLCRLSYFQDDTCERIEMRHIHDLYGIRNSLNADCIIFVIVCFSLKNITFSKQK